jgi:hypothetical protein
MSAQTLLGICQVRVPLTPYYRLFNRLHSAAKMGDHCKHSKWAISQSETTQAVHCTTDSRGCTVCIETFFVPAGEKKYLYSFLLHSVSTFGRVSAFPA